MKLPSFQSFGLPLAIFLGLVFPYGKSLEMLVSPILIILLFLSFMKIQEWSRTWNFLIILKVFVSILLISAFIFFIGRIFNFEKTWLIGLVLTSLAPTALSSPVIVHYLSGNLVLVTQILLSLNILSIFYIPAFFSLFFHENISVDPMLMMGKMAFIVFLPLLGAFIFRYFCWDKKIQPFVGFLSFPLLSFVLWIIFSKNSYFLINSFENQWFYIIFIFIFAAFNFTIGYFLSRKYCFTTAVSLGYKNSILIILLSLQFFPQETVLVPTLYVIAHHIINSVLIMYGHKKNQGLFAPS